MKFQKIFALLVVAALSTFVTGCDDSLGSCTFSSDEGSYCYSVTNDDYTQDDMKDSCNAINGDYSEKDCDVDNPVGTCEYSSGGNSFEQQYGGGYDAAGAEDACDLLGGTWTDQ